ncbi:hypothetical protein D9Q98_002566 [Chlorella vulgaris]|uniref:Uncharacterized protein n=2 Tax=Chlorella vulgaris TaxID=3077 RepID=A0A9D4TUX3_CHLVU|nr:hypothetical protein D9Q98_002566 [Chlorella vulgaris]
MEMLAPCEVDCDNSVRMRRHVQPRLLDVVMQTTVCSILRDLYQRAWQLAPALVATIGVNCMDSSTSWSFGSTSRADGLNSKKLCQVSARSEQTTVTCCS